MQTCKILCPGKRVGPLTSVIGLSRAAQALEQAPGVRAELGLARIKRVREIDAEIATLTRRIARAVRDAGTALVGIPGVGSLTAAKFIAEVGNVRRFSTKSAFAMACGTAPIPASSGNTVRHRLNRGGNRQLNRALHVVAFVQARSHPPAIAYLERKRSEGKSRMEALRCLKRHLANVVYVTMIAEQERGSARPLDT